MRMKLFAITLFATIITLFLLASTTVFASREDSTQPSGLRPMLAKATQAYVTAPPDIPIVTVTVPYSGTGDTYLFLSAIAFSRSITPYLMIVDEQGTLVYYKPPPSGLGVLDLKVVNNDQLAYFVGNQYPVSTTGVYEVLNADYTLSSTWAMTNGLAADWHDFRLLPDGHALLMAYPTRTVDMSVIVSGGNPGAQVIGLAFQELDANKNVVFEWSSWEHVPITDTQNETNLTASVIDYVHGNAVELDFDGNYLISSRHLDEITKISRQTGQIMWRLGGKRDEFTWVNAPRKFRWQHDIRRLSNGHLMLFDNASNSPNVTAYSRAIEYEIDEASKVVTQVREIPASPNIFSFAMGNAQRLANGNTLIGWGAVPTTSVAATEVRSDNSVAFEMQLQRPHWSYRVLRSMWRATPAYPPTLMLSDVGGSPALYFSWNGATDVTSYTVYAGYGASTPIMLGTVAKTGFETSYDVSATLSQYCFYRVQPIDKSGKRGLMSNLVQRDSTCVSREFALPFVARTVENR
jgi:hypothetical protein